MSFLPGPTRHEFDAAGMDRARDAFLTSEEGATARLMAFYRQARLEIVDFLTSGTPTPNDTSFLQAVSAEADRIMGEVDAGARQWIESTIPPAFTTGALTASPKLVFTVAHELGLDALAKDTLGLIQNTNEGVRRSIQGAIAQGMLQSLPPAEIRQRIIDSGLQPGPWKDVETRAGVIARTETMRAYNAGNLAGVEANGAVAVEWIVAPDEATCPTCRPRGGVTFVLPSVTSEERLALGIPAPGAGLPGPHNEDVHAWGRLPDIPAHPRCRCTTGAVYFGPDGQYLARDPLQDQIAPATPAEVPPPVPTGPPADWSTRLDSLTKPDPAKATAETALQAKQAEWNARQAELTKVRDELMNFPVPGVGVSYGGVGGALGPAAQGAFGLEAIAAKGGQAGVDLVVRYKNALDAEKLAQEGFFSLKRQGFRPDQATLDYWRALDLSPAMVDQIAAMKGEIGLQAMENLLAYRYGMRFERFGTAMTQEIRRAFISAFERYKAIAPQYVTSSPTLIAYADHPFGKRFGSGTLGEYFPTLHTFRVNNSGMKRYVDKGTLRGGPDVQGAEEVVVHEIGHSIEQYLNGSGNAREMRAAWDAARRQTAAGKIAVDLDPASILKMETDLAKYEAALAGGARYNAAGRRFIDTLRRKLAAAKTGGPGGVEHYPTEYALRGGSPEDMAETIMLYLLNPAKLKAFSPARYAWARDYVFGGKEIAP